MMPPQRLLKKLKLPAGLLDALTDWIDSDDAPLPEGAETAYYQALKTPYNAKNSNLDSLEELLLVRGFNAKTLDTLRPYVTIYSDVQTILRRRSTSIRPPARFWLRLMTR